MSSNDLINTNEAFDLLADFEQWKTEQARGNPDLSPTEFLRYRSAVDCVARLGRATATAADVVNVLDALLKAEPELTPEGREVLESCRNLLQEVGD